MAKWLFILLLPVFLAVSGCQDITFATGIDVYDDGSYSVGQWVYWAFGGTDDDEAKEKTEPIHRMLPEHLPK